MRDVYSLGFGGSLSQDRSKGIAVILEEKNSNETANFLLSKGKNRNLAAEIEGQNLGERMRDLNSPFGIYVPGLAGIPAFEEFKSEGIVRRAAAKGDANNVFRNILWLLKQDNSKWTNFISDLNDIFPNLTLHISFDKLKDEHINAFIESDGRRLPIDAYGTGILQAIQILSYVHLYNPKILMLDEPDSHLHASNQRLLAEKLSEITTRMDFQLLLSTHSRHLLDAFKDYASIKWISKGKIKDQSYSFVSVLLEIGALDKGDVLNNGNTRCVVLSEDANNAPLKTVLNANGFDLNETEIWSYEGCSKIETAIVLAAFIKSNVPGTTVLIHRDTDYLSTEEMAEIQQKATSANIEIFFTTGTDIENHFLNVDHIKKIYPEVDVADIRNVIADATNDVKQKSLENFVNARMAAALQVQYAGGARANAGQISTACNRDYEGDSSKYRHGKKALRALKKRLQNTYGLKELLIPTEDLRTTELGVIKRKIWPAP